jgi:hypothetical protein
MCLKSLVRENRTPEPVLSEAEGICAGGRGVTPFPTAMAASHQGEDRRKEL